MDLGYTAVVWIRSSGSLVRQYGVSLTVVLLVVIENSGGLVLLDGGGRQHLNAINSLPLMSAVLNLMASVLHYSTCIQKYSNFPLTVQQSRYHSHHACQHRPAAGHVLNDERPDSREPAVYTIDHSVGDIAKPDC